MSTKTEVLLADEAPIFEMEELRGLIAEGQEKGVLTFEQIATCLEEVEVTKEQVGELHSTCSNRASTSSAPMGARRRPRAARVEAQAEARATARRRRAGARRSRRST